MIDKDIDRYSKISAQSETEVSYTLNALCHDIRLKCFRDCPDCYKIESTWPTKFTARTAGARGALDLLKCSWQALRQECLVSRLYDRVLADHAQKEGDELGLC